MKGIKIKPLSRFIARGALAMMMVMMVPSFAGASTTAETEFTANIQSASCTVKSDSVVDLGAVSGNGSWPGPPLTININCNGAAVNTYLWGQVIKGDVSYDSIHMIENDNSTFILYLTDAANSSAGTIDFSGNKSFSFCAGTGTRECRLNTRLTIMQSSANSTASVTLRFNLEHK